MDTRSWSGIYKTVQFGSVPLANGTEPEHNAFNQRTLNLKYGNQTHGLYCKQNMAPFLISVQPFYADLIAIYQFLSNF
jgi:hypothetical protein